MVTNSTNSTASSLSPSEMITAIGPEYILTGIGVILLGYFANKASNILIKRAIDKKSGGEHAIKSAQRLSGYVIYSLTIIAVLGVFGVPLSGLTAAIGLLGLGISFALKDIIANFISGILIMIYHPIKIGDQIEVGGEEGTVRNIKTRATELKTYDGRKVIIPNAQIYNSQIINNTAYSKRRFNVIVGISYDDDIKKAKELAEEVLEEAESVESTPEPQVLVDELGGSSVNLKLRGWTHNKRSDLLHGSSEVTQLIKEKYDEAGIDIPYPIRTIFMSEEVE